MFGWKHLKTFSFKAEAESIAEVLKIQGINSKITNDQENELTSISMSKIIKLWVKDDDIAEALDVLTQNERAA